MLCGENPLRSLWFKTPPSHPDVLDRPALDITHSPAYLAKDEGKGEGSVGGEAAVQHRNDPRHPRRSRLG
jgi:hypothetical protein